MLYGLLVTLFVFLSLFLALIILVQKGKGGLGLGHFSGSTQLLFGGSGGTDLLQKITWVCGSIFMVGILALSILKVHTVQKSTILPTGRVMPAQQAEVQEQDTQETAQPEAEPAQEA